MAQDVCHSRGVRQGRLPVAAFDPCLATIDCELQVPVEIGAATHHHGLHQLHDCYHAGQ